MSGLRRRLVLAYLVCAVNAVLAAEVAPGIHSTGEVLVSVRGDYVPSPASVAALERSGWTVRKLVTVRERVRLIDAADAKKTWLLITPPPMEAPALHPWDVSHRMVHRLPAEAGIDLEQVIEVEPVVGYEMTDFADRLQRKSEEKNPTTCPTPAKDSVTACVPASFQWPNVKRTSWHREDDRTQLGKAEERARPFFANSPRVLIAHLDTGYYETVDHITPPHFNYELSHSMIPNDPCGETGIDCYKGGLPNGHGPETLSILAGGDIRVQAADGYPEHHGYVGGAPLAEVFTLRVSRSVVLLYPYYVAQGIFQAITNRADVVSMSMGGVPSNYLRDSVNAAYDSGTAMFFAAADFFRLPVPLVTIEIPPHTMVYPARFAPTTPVAGITASERPYPLNPSSFLNVLRGDASSWMLRGSYGPLSEMQDRALTAYSPNITSRYGNAQGVANQLKYDFDGTSAATPQAAAAAALWLQVHRKEFQEGEWRSWVKAESAYDALIQSARLQSSNDVVYFGAGVIQANKALDVPKPANPVQRPPAKIGFDWVTVLAALLGINPNEPPPTGHRAAIQMRMYQLEVAQLVTTEPDLREILNGDFESMPSKSQLERLARAIERHPRASQQLRRSVAARN